MKQIDRLNYRKKDRYTDNYIQIDINIEKKTDRYKETDRQTQRDKQIK